jgi:hypothetical protein
MLPYFLDIIAEDDSPYPEVRSAVANFDDPEMPTSTVRAWTLGLIWAILLSGMNQFFYFRYPSVVIGGVSFDLQGRFMIDKFTSLYKHSLSPNSSCSQ